MRLGYVRLRNHDSARTHATVAVRGSSWKHPEKLLHAYAVERPHPCNLTPPWTSDWGAIRADTFERQNFQRTWQRATVQLQPRNNQLCCWSGFHFPNKVSLVVWYDPKDLRLSLMDDVATSSVAPELYSKSTIPAYLISNSCNKNLAICNIIYIYIYIYNHKYTFTIYTYTCVCVYICLSLYIYM